MIIFKLVGSKLIILILFLLFGVRPASAVETPILLNPANGITNTSSRLEWQTPSYSLYSSNPYRVQVDDDPSFSSLNKDYYTNNTYYTPTLSFGTWNWRVKAKDVSGIWSEWSNIWSFILSDSTSTPTPTQTPISTPSPASTSSSPQLTSSFTISNIPSQINSDQSFSVSINLTLPNNKNAEYFLSGAFKKADGTRYFGLTKINADWIKYESGNYLNQYKITTDNNGNWTGTLEVKPDTSDTDYKGSGDYIFKVGRYTSSGSGPTWSNESTIKIISTESDEGATSTNTPFSTTNSPTSPPSVKTKPTTSSSSQPKSFDKLVYHDATVAGATASASTFASSSPNVEVKSQKQVSPIVWVGLVFIFAGTGSLGYIYWKRRRQ